jgi:hypothetical protein
MPILRTIVNTFGNVVDRIGGLFEETQVARYVTLAGSGAGFTVPDSTAPLPSTDHHIQDIHAPGLVNGSLPVIFFRTSHAGSPSFSVRLNSAVLTQHTLSDSGPHNWHEIIPAGALKSAANELTLAVTGDGSVRFSDILILYTSNKLTVRRPFPDEVLAPT